MARRIRALLYKEFIQVLRDPLALWLLLLLPIVMLLVFAYAINLDVRNIPIAVYDLDRTELSRSIVDRFVTSGYFVLKKRLTADSDIAGVLDRGEVKVALHFPRDFQKDIFNGKNTPLQVIIDGTDCQYGKYHHGLCEGDSCRRIHERYFRSSQLKRHCRLFVHGHTGRAPQHLVQPRACQPQFSRARHHRPHRHGGRRNPHVAVAGEGAGKGHHRKPHGFTAARPSSS